MRLSPQRHTLAVLRTVIGITQKEMAALLECSVPTVQAVELGKLKLSDRLGERVREQTHISLQWLLDNNVGQPPVGDGGKPYTKAIFEEVQSRIRNPAPDPIDITAAHCFFHSIVRQLAASLVSAYENNKLALCQYRLMTSNQHLFEEFGESASLLAATDKDGKRAVENVRLQFILHISKICDQRLALAASSLASKRKAESSGARSQHLEKSESIRRKGKSGAIKSRT